MRTITIQTDDTRIIDARLITELTRQLKAGAVAILPTDTVYGIAVAALANTSPAPLFAVKARDTAKPIACLIPDANALAIYGQDVHAHTYQLAQKHWPGALTLVVKASDCIPQAFMATDGSIALRAPNHPFIQALLQKLKAPLATTSANISGQPDALCLADIAPNLKAAANIIIDGGKTAGGVASTIVSCLGPAAKIIREGAISAAELLIE